VPAPSHRHQHGRPRRNIGGGNRRAFATAHRQPAGPERGQPRRRSAEVNRLGEVARRRQHHRHRAPRAAASTTSFAPLRPQGTSGSRFFLSLQDDLMRIFMAERMEGMLQKLGLKEDEAIIHPWINRALEKAQQKVEARNFDIRKNLLKFDNVMNDHAVIFGLRLDLMTRRTSPDDWPTRHEVIADLVAKLFPKPTRAVGRQGPPRGLQQVLNLDLPVEA
jgi:hypothetical protein